MKVKCNFPLKIRHWSKIGEKKICISFKIKMSIHFLIGFTGFSWIFKLQCQFNIFLLQFDTFRLKFFCSDFWSFQSCFGLTKINFWNKIILDYCYVYVGNLLLKWGKNVAYTLGCPGLWQITIIWCI